MDFLRRLFHKQTEPKKLSIIDIPPQPQVDINANTVECNGMVNNSDASKNDVSVDSNDDDDSPKILYTLENVVPIDLTNETAEEILVNSIKEDTVSLDSTTNDFEVKEDEVLYENTFLKENNVTESLKEFDEALQKFEQTHHYETEFINLNEFNQIFDDLDTVNEHLRALNASDANELELIGKIANSNDNCEVTEDKTYRIENIDVISIHSSAADEISQEENIKDSFPIDEDDTSDCDSYHSSDFEFISETEAKMDGLIINFRQKQNSEEFSFAGQFMEELIGNVNDFDPGEGPSRPRNEFEDRTYRSNHSVPEGDDFLGLFQGIYNPLLPISEICMLENKSIRTSAMNIQYDGIGFDKQLALRRHQPDSSEEEFEDEAKETAKKILNKYPSENKKRRRRI